jgi:hypothetical protein
MPDLKSQFSHMLHNFVNANPVADAAAKREKLKDFFHDAFPPSCCSAALAKPDRV